MIDVTDILNSLKTQLEADIAFSAFIEVVEIEEFINLTADRAPWACLYPNDVEYVPRTLGQGMNNWEGQPSIKIILQAAHPNDARVCASNLNDYVKAFIDAVETDRTISGTIDMIVGYKVNYTYLLDERHEMHFKAAEVTISMRVKTS